MSELENQSSEKMNEEAAEAEYARFAELWDIDTATDAMGEDDIDSYEKAKRPIVRGFMQGWLTCDEDGVLSFELKFSKKLDIEVLTLDPAKADVLSMDKYKDRQSMHKMKAYLAAMAGTSVNKLAKLDPRDEKRIRGAVLLFLGS